VTVQDHLRNTCDKLVESLMQHNRDLATRIVDEAEEGIKELQEAVAEARQAEEEENKENEAGTAGSEGVEGGASAGKKKAKVAKGLTNLLLVASCGPHIGEEFVVKPRKRRVFPIGRSTGKKFLSGGVSLKDDHQVSTTHGKISVSRYETRAAAVVGGGAYNAGGGLTMGRRGGGAREGVHARVCVQCSNFLFLSTSSRLSDGTIMFKDNSSTNGTYLNDVILEEQKEYALSEGDFLQVGETTFQVQLVAA
jgi:hypothetical protein